MSGFQRYLHGGKVAYSHWGDDRDRYDGTQADLIAGGFAKAEWFPSSPVPYAGRGGPGIKRHFKIQDGDRSIELWDKGRGKWRLTVPCPAEEVARRRGDAQPAQQRSEVDPESITLAPAVALDTITADELHHLRVLRTISDSRREFIADTLQATLVAEAVWGTLAVPQRPARRLQLVVDNGEASPWS